MPFSNIHRHGWLLCSDGARQADSTVAASCAVLMVSCAVARSAMSSSVRWRRCQAARGKSGVEPGARATEPFGRAIQPMYVRYRPTSVNPAKTMRHKVSAPMV